MMSVSKRRIRSSELAGLKQQSHFLPATTTKRKNFVKQLSFLSVSFSPGSTYTTMCVFQMQLLNTNQFLWKSIRKGILQTSRMGKILAGGSGKIHLQMIGTRKPREGGLWHGWIWFLSKVAKSRGTGEKRKNEVREAMYFPRSGETWICHVIGVSWI